jgi:hypothetical protein
LKKAITKTGLVEWLKVKALSSNPSTEKKKEWLPGTRREESGSCLTDTVSLLQDVQALEICCTMVAIYVNYLTVHLKMLKTVDVLLCVI